jgi:hypothetical protein
MPLALSVGARAQCILANPSFENVGSGGTMFDGWNQFGNVHASGAMAVHGSRGAACTGRNNGTWDLSGVWQSHDIEPGQRMEARVRVGHEAGDPLSGTTRALVNIEWRDASGGLISYESHTVADEATATGQMLRVSIESAPAPAETVSTRLVLGVLQGPTNDPGTAHFDLARFRPEGSATDQWSDFGDRRIEFSGMTWRVKGPGLYGPGPNHFSDTEENVWVDAEGRLHLKITRVGGRWYCTEVVPEEPLGYGDYIFKTLGRVDRIDEKAVLGLFLWEYAPCYDGIASWNVANEFDIELSRWGSTNNEPAQFVAQPWSRSGNIERYELPLASDDAPSSHAFRWVNDRVECRSWYGHADRHDDSTLIHEWTYRGPDIPRPEEPRVHINFWLMFGEPPLSGQEQEVILSEFLFIPMCAQDLTGDGLVNTQDFLAFLNAWANGDPLADWNDDGTINTQDFLAYLNDWAAGC